MSAKLFLINILLIIVQNFSTGVERKISGVMKVTGKSGRAEYNIKYNSLPLTYDTNLAVLDTDYKNYAVIYSCSSLGPIANTREFILILNIMFLFETRFFFLESVWVMTRERIPPGPVLQAAYGVLDNYKISRSFFIKTDQENCEKRPKPSEAESGSTVTNANKPNVTNYIIIN